MAVPIAVPVGGASMWIAVWTTGGLSLAVGLAMAAVDRRFGRRQTMASAPRPNEVEPLPQAA